MPLKSDIDEATDILERLQTSLVKCEDIRQRVQCAEDISTIMRALHNPVLNKIVSIQDAVECLSQKVAQHPSLLPEDFDISVDGKFLLHSSSVDDEPEDAILIEPACSTKTSIDSQSHFSTANEDELSSSNSNSHRRLESMRTASPSSPHKITEDDEHEEEEEEEEEDEIEVKDVEVEVEDGDEPLNQLNKLVEMSAAGRQVHHIRLYKPEGTSLGFSVVGLKSEQRGDLGIFIKDIQPSGIAGMDGRLQDGDQILGIDGHILDSFISHQKAIRILQNASNTIDLYVARDPSLEVQTEVAKNLENHLKLLHPFSSTHIVPPTQESHTSNMLNTEWAQVEIIHLVNDGTGLGFGIIGGRSTGVVVKTILPGGVAEREGRLQSGDHILQINDVNLRGMGSDQVASVLRQAGNHVRLVVARPVESASPELQSDRTAPIIETRMLNDPEELERHLTSMNDPQSLALIRTLPPTVLNGHSDLGFVNGDNEILTISNETEKSLKSSASIDSVVRQPSQEKEVIVGGEELSIADLPEMESIEVSITKDSQGLGITIAGYVCEREELSGIFVKSVNEGSAADRSGQIQVNDQIVEVDGNSLSGLSNHSAVEVLKSTGKNVQLKLVRYLRGPKFEQLQQAIANSELKTTPSTPNPTRSSLTEMPNCEALRSALINLEDDQDETEESTPEPPPMPKNETRIEDIELLIDHDYSGCLKPSVATAIQRKWSKIVGDDMEIVVAQLTKFEKGGGLGISLEGTVDVEDGKEVRPHHYIRSILPEGPVGKDGALKSGDELLEVNNRKLLGLNHLEVVAILKELPQCVRLVCGRRCSSQALHPIDAPTADRDTFAARNILGGSLQNLLPCNDRLVKAKSDGSLSSSAPSDNSFKVRSRSLEPLTGLAMWSSDTQEIDLLKGDRGLGFSILDYQDPINPQDTVIVIRSLVPGGVAEKDGRLIPGDRLIAVNGISLENASLDTAVACLKGAPKGLVKIAVAKPVSVLESPGQLDLILGQRSDTESDYTDDSESRQSPNQTSEESMERTVIKRQSTSESDKGRPTPTQRSLPEPLVPLPVASERLMGGMPRPPRFLERQSSTTGSQSEEDLPFELESTQKVDSYPKSVVIRVHSSNLGFSYDLKPDGVVIKSIKENASIDLDGRLTVGDVITSVAGYSTKNRNETDVRAIISSLESSDEISVSYIPSKFVDTWSSRSSKIPVRTDKPRDDDDPFTITFSNVSEADICEKSEEEAGSPEVKVQEEETEEIRPSDSMSAMDGKHWGPERRVEVRRDEKGSLGISIVGGKVDLAWNDSSVSGIFIKNVLSNSPAGKSALLKTGDRILEVEGTDLRNASHEKAVDVIKKTGDPVFFVVQSLVQWTPASSMPASRDQSRLASHQPSAVTPARTPSPELIQAGIPDEVKQEIQEKSKPKPEPSFEDESGEESDDETALQGHTFTAAGRQIERNSAGAIKLSDTSGEDEFGYTIKKVEKKYSKMGGTLLLVDLQKPPDAGIGITLSGHKDRTKMAVFICGMHPNGCAFKDGRLNIGDEILEVNGHVLQGISHLNASKVFRQITDPEIKIVIRRTENCLEEMAVKPITQFPVSLEDESPEERYSHYKGITRFVLNKGQSGLGIMIIEGKHAEYGQGIFISDLQEGSIAAEAGLMVGDMILCVNKEDMIGISYEEATSIVRRLEGAITMYVANTTRAKSATPKSLTPQPKPDTPLPKSETPQPKPGTPQPPSKTPDLKKPEERPEPAETNSKVITPFVETPIEILKEKMGLGLSIVGGTDTLLGSIHIHEVYQGGAADLDGRLKPGDQILEVNNESFLNMTHVKALSVLRQTPSKVKMIVYREEVTDEEGLYDFIEVQLTKKTGRGLGLSIVGRKTGVGVFISDLVPGGVAEQDGRLMQGDRILNVNDTDLRNVTQEHAATILKCAPPIVNLKVGRLKPGRTMKHANLTWPILLDDSPRNSLCIDTYLPSEGGIRTVFLQRGEEGLGFSIVGGHGSNLGDLPIYVKSVFDRGAAYKEGSLCRGDQILEVNGISLNGLNHAQAVSILKEARGTVLLTILPTK